MIQLGQIYGSVVGECVGRVTVSIGGRGGCSEMLKPRFMAHAN